MNELLGSRFEDCEILNEVTAKVFTGKTTYILKLSDYSTGIAPYLMIQNNGGSDFVVRVYQFEHLYLDELPKSLISSLEGTRKEYLLKNPSLYLQRMEYIQGFPFWEYVSSRETLGAISPKYLTKFIKESYSGLDAIHDAGYYHGDLGMPDNILLEGSYENWTRLVIIDVEGGKIKTKDDVDSDISTLGYMIWIVIVGNNIASTEDDHGDVIHSEHPMFIDFVKRNMRQFRKYNKYLDLLLWIFQQQPTTKEIIAATQSL